MAPSKILSYFGGEILCTCLVAFLLSDSIFIFTSINSSPRKADLSPSKSVPTKDTSKKHSKSSDDSSASCTSTSAPPERQSSSSAKDESDNDSSKVTSTTADIDVKCEPTSPTSPPSKHIKGTYHLVEVL